MNDRPVRLLMSKAALAGALLAFCAAGDASAEHAPQPSTASLEFAVGADLSFLADAESRGARFRDEDGEKPGLVLFRDHGYRWIRLRLFHTPDRLPNDLAYTTELAREAKRLGYRFLLDLHYSDTWADPGKQFLPKAWEGLSHEELVAAVRGYTHTVVAQLSADGAAPDMVQIGNEVIGGMLWPDGKLPGRWPEFAELLRAGVAGAREATPDSPPLVMLHIDRGGDLEATRYFFDRCREHRVDFDVIGQSYYPWWHGEIDDLRKNLAFMADAYGKDIVLVEVAYNWRRGEYPGDDGPFPETPEGQRRFLEAVTRAVRETPHGLGKGVFWWEPAVAGGPIHGRGMFDQRGRALPAIHVFDQQAGGE